MQRLPIDFQQVNLLRMTPQDTKDLAARIAAQNLPAFGASLVAMRRVMATATASGRQMAEVILRDPALTANVLRAANSVVFSPSREASSSGNAADRR